MASREGEGSQPVLTPNNEHNSWTDDDTESESSYAGSARSASNQPPCPHRTPEFNDQECSRFFDCPTHVVERVAPDDPTPQIRREIQSSEHGTEPIQRDSNEDGGTSRLAHQDTTSGELNGQNDSVFNTGSLPNPAAASGPGEALVSTARAPGVEVETQRIQDAELTRGTSHISLLDAVNGPTARPRVMDLGGVQLGSGTAGAANQILQPPASSTPSSRVSLLEALSDAAARSQDLDLGRTQLESGTAVAASQIQPPASARPLSSGQTGLRGDVTTYRPLQPPVQPTQPPPRRRGLPEITLPRWQPDAEVTYCPICHQQFSFLVRKHHCRKCGRVVCASCSPHRITIPHQYIVRPPGDMSRLRASVLFGEEGGVADFSAIGGGERVRLCNPCVPDPNTTPPHAQRSPGTDLLQPRSVHHRSHSSASGTGNAGNVGNTLSYLPLPYIASQLIGNAPNDAGSRSRSATVYSSSHRAGSRGVPSLTQNLTQNRILSGTPPTYYPYPSGYASSSSSRYQPPAQPHYQSLLDNLAASSSSSAASRNNRPLPPPPPQQIPEEDECPVCHRELPSQRLPNFEALRESHITTCITQHSTYGPPAATSNQLGAHGTPPQRIARRTGMFPYAATEKDCVDSAECTICLEEFSVGVPMARLECLCRFHRSCIEAWFVNHPGRCPVHQHDSFGY